MASDSQHRPSLSPSTTLFASSPYAPAPEPPTTINNIDNCSSGSSTSLYAAYPYRSSFLDDPPPPASTLYAAYPFPSAPSTNKTRTARPPPQQRNPESFANMTEVAFAKQFLAALDARPVKLSADHVEDPRSYPARSAVCSSPSSLSYLSILPPRPPSFARALN